jgi:radical SAM protein with 4Fe4S-binding SPASM domain
MNISKSAFIQGLTCHKKLWLNKNRPELLKPTNSKFTKTGVDVGVLAQSLFTGGELVEFGNFKQMLEKTTELLKTKNIIYEATFSGNDGFAMLDILVKNNNKWDIYEVKSSTSIKENYIIDSGYQRFVASKDINIGDNYIIHINNKYTRVDSLNITKLFTIQNITDEVLAVMPTIHKSLKQQQDILKGDEPQTIINKNCMDCEYKKYCFYECLNIPK